MIGQDCSFISSLPPSFNSEFFFPDSFYDSVADSEKEKEFQRIFYSNFFYSFIFFSGLYSFPHPRLRSLKSQKPFSVGKRYNFSSLRKKKSSIKKNSAILSFLVHTVMIRFSALGAYLLLISKGTALSRNGALLRNTALFNFQEKKILRKNLWCLFEKDQEHWWTNMLSLDLSWSERTATKSSSQNLKARSFV